VRAFLAAVALLAAGWLLIAYGIDRAFALALLCWALAAGALLSSAGSISRHIQRSPR
jgi:hypothetical protein